MEKLKEREKKIYEQIIFLENFESNLAEWLPFPSIVINAVEYKVTSINNLFKEIFEINSENKSEQLRLVNSELGLMDVLLKGSQKLSLKELLKKISQEQ